MGNIDESDDRINQLEDLKQELNALKRSFNQEFNIRKSLEFALQERLKELNCHNHISKLMSNSELSTFEVLEEIVRIIPAGWQFPEVAEALITVYEHTFQTPGYRVSKNHRIQDVKVNGEAVGRVEVCYPEELKPETDQIFLPEETDLLFSIAERIGNFIEIDEKKSVLKQSEEKFRTLVETVSEIIYEFTSQGTINYISPSVEKILGYQPEELIGQSVFNILHADDRPVLAERLASDEIIGSSFHEYRFVTKSGEIRWLGKSTSSIHKEGNLISRIGTLKDITEQKLAEISLSESENKYRTLFNDSPDGYLIIQNGIFVECNHSSELLLKGDRSQIIGKTPALVSPLYQPNGRLSSELAQERIQEVMEKGNITFEWIHQKFDGSLFTAQVNVSMIVLNDQPALLTSWKDITERKKAEDEILRANRLYAVISQVNQAIVYIKVKHKLLEEICRIAIDFGKFRMVWIGLLDEESGIVKPAFSNGWEDGYLTHIKPISLTDSPEGHGPTANALREGCYFVCNDIETDPHMAPWKEEALKRGYRSSIALPIKQFGKINATLNIYSAVSYFFNPEEIKLLEEVAGDISFALEAIEIEADRIKAEQESKKFRTITEQGNFGSAITTADGFILYVNPAFAHMHQLEPEEIIGKNLGIFHNSEQFPKVKESLEKLAVDGQFTAEEIWHVRKDGSVFPTLMNAKVIFDQHNNPLFLSATAIDISETKKKEEELIQSEHDLNHAQEIGGMGSWEHIFETNELKVSANYYRQLGLQPGEKKDELYNYFISLIHPDDLKVIDYLQTTTYKENTTEIVDLRIVLPSGEIRWLQNNVVPIFSNGKLAGLKGVNIDVTERRNAEQEAIKFRTITDQANYGTAIATLDGIILYANREFAGMHQYEPEEVIGKNLSIFHNQEQMVRVAETIEMLKLYRKFSAEEVWRTRKDGSVFPSLMNGSVIVDSNNVPQFIAATAIDITEIKQHEEAILHSEEVLNYAQEIAKMGSWELDLRTGKLDLSKNYYSILGLDPANLDNLQEVLSQRIHPEDTKRQQQILEEIRQTHQATSVSYQITMPDGQTKWIQNNVVPVIEDDELVGIKGVNIDITEKKLAEEEIRQQNERLSAIISAMPDLMFVADQYGTNQEFYTNHPDKLLAPVDRIIGTNVKELFDAETADLHIQKIEECIEQQKLTTYEYSMYEGSSLLFFEARLAPLGKDRVLTFIRDITDKKQKDIQIRKLSQAVEQSPVLVAITDLNGSIEYVNEAFSKVTGYSLQEAIGKNPRILKSGQTEQSVYDDLWNTITSGKTWQGEWINRKKNGELYWESVSITPIHDESGKVTNYVAVKQDITQRKKDEQEIKDLNTSLERKVADRTAALNEINASLIEEIEQREQVSQALQAKTNELENFFTVALDLLCIADTSGNFIKVNKAWEKILGYSSSELEHRQFLDFVHPDDIQATLDVMSELSEQNPVLNFTNRYRTRTGEYRYIEWRSSPAGNRIYAAARDITNRLRDEQFEDELLQLSSKLTGIPSSEIDNALNLALNRIGQFLGADRSYIFEFSADELSFSNTYEWCNEGITPEIGNMQDIPTSAFPIWMETLLKHDSVLIPSVADLPESWKAEREILEPQGIQSLIAIPMLTENKLIGFVGLDSVRQRKEYTNSEINILKVWSSMLSSLINNKKVESKLEQTRQNYETFFNTIDDFLWVLDEQGNIIHTNNTVKRRLEYSDAELENKSVLMVHPPERREEAGRIVGEMLAGISEFCPVPVITKSGHPIPVETRVKAGFWNGSPVIFGVSKDISQISLSEKKFSTAFHANSAMMAISYFNGGEYVDINNAFLETMGYKREEIIGKTNRELTLFVDPDLRGAIIRKLVNDIPVRKLEMEMRTKSGEIKKGLLSADSFYIGDKRCILTVNVDITERVKAEEEAKKARTEAEQANMAKSEFLSRMSHELRTPMNAILGFAQLLEMGQLNPAQKKGVDHILNGGKHLLDLINEVLDISRIESGRLSLSSEPVKLNEVLLEMIDTIQPLANMKQVQLTLIDSAVNSEFIKADRQRLKQVLMNLINNAVKYNKTGGSISIQAEIMPIRNNKEYIRISVTDTGYGIHEEDISKLFKPFERIGAEFTGAEGSGLGLTVVKKLMDAMQGEVGLESKFGEGSTFWIELQHVESQLKNVEKANLSTNSDSETGNKKGIILCIEDNVSNIELVEQILSSQRPGLQLIVNTNGKSAVDLAVQFKPDLILLDLNLPDIHGKDVLTLLMADERTTDIPVIVISADAMPQQLERLLNGGAKKYMTKPLDVALFLKTIDMYIVS